MGGEYVVIETQNGDGIVGEIPEGASVPNISSDHPNVLPLEEAQQIVENLNGPGEGGND